MFKYACVVCGLTLALAVWAMAGNESVAQKTTARESGGSQGASLPEFTAEREAKAQQFVREHHAELAELLTQLKASNRTEYEQAIRELFRTSETLAASKTRDPKRYEIDLEAWKIESRIRLLVARMARSGSRAPALEAELKTALYEQVDNRLRQQELSMERLKKSIESLKHSRDTQVERRFSTLMKSVSDMRSTSDSGSETEPKKKKKPAKSDKTGPGNR